MAYNMFLKVGVGKEAVDGDSTDEKHENWIEVVSYSHGVTMPREAASGLAVGTRQHQDFTITKRVDKASVPLMSKLLNNANIPEVKLELCRATGEKTTFMAYTLNDCRISAIFPRASGKAEDPLPFEEVRFCYRMITWTYTTTATGGRGQDQVYEAMDDIGQGAGQE
jgi:type VI secretion system secreted protein Hcp